jgi:hypothetical protein
MEKKFIDITEIHTPELFKQVSEYTDALIDEATANGSLNEQGANNEYTREIGRVGRLCADYESMHMKFEHLKFKSPLLVCIETANRTRNPDKKIKFYSFIIGINSLVKSERKSGIFKIPSLYCKFLRE